MLRMILSVAWLLVFSIVWGQAKRFYTLNDDTPFDTVHFSLNAASGNCILRTAPDIGHSPLVIYGNPNLERVNPSFRSHVTNNTCLVELDLDEYRSSNFGDGLVYAVMRSDEKDDFWKIHLDDQKIYKLDLSYGVGNADINLSNAAVKAFRLRSGTADINVDYSRYQPNKTEMDTFSVHVDMGSFKSKHLELANARRIIANIGFGSALLDLEQGLDHPCDIKASIGAGNLDIVLPKKDIPIIIYMKDSPLCGASMAPGFEEVEKNVFVNMAYSSGAENLMTFNVDVAMGTVNFAYKN